MWFHGASQHYQLLVAHVYPSASLVLQGNKCKARQGHSIKRGAALTLPESAHLPLYPSTCEDGFECGHRVGWFRVVRGGAASLLFLCTCQLDLETVSEFRSIERFSTADTTQQY